MDDLDGQTNGQTNGQTKGEQLNDEPDELTLIYGNMKQIIEVSQVRGCWKASEMKDIGITYETILQLIDKLKG